MIIDTLGLFFHMQCFKVHYCILFFEKLLLLLSALLFIIQ